MKLRIANADPDGIPYRLRDLQIRVTRWGIVAQSKPKRRKRPWSKLQQQYRKRFAWAGFYASNPEPLCYLTAVEMAKGTEQVPRDILTMAAMGQYYELANPDGTAWRHLERPVLSDPLCHRPAAFQLARTVWPPAPEYLSLGDAWRLALEYPR